MKSRASMPLPYMADVGVIGLVPDTWGSPWLSRQQVLTRLARYFNVVWCNPPRSWKLWSRRRTQYQGVDDGSTTMPGLTIYHPEAWLPAVGRPMVLARLTMRERLRRAQQRLQARGCRTTIVSIWRPWYGLALDVMPHDLSCYHIADEYTFSVVEKPIEEQEARLISRVDQVFIHSPALMEKKGKLNPQTIFAPNGVDYQRYAAPHAEPADLKPIPSPRIGYVGVIKKQLDLALLIALAERHRQWSFVLVGPQGNLSGQMSLMQQLSQMPNVYFLGAKPVDTLPAYTQHMDVCMLCYKVDDYTKYIYPLKLHEYLASGRPVVGSPIRSLQEFAQIIKLAHTVDEWSQALLDLLSPSTRSAAQIEARRSIARQYDWNKLVRLIARTMCSRLGPAYLDRFDSIPSQESAPSRGATSGMS